MHALSIPKWAVERVVERHGTAHPYADLDPARTALVVVDMQNGFMVQANVRAEKVAKRIESMTEGSVGHQLYPELDIKPGDTIVQKYRFSAFLPESSDLAVRLRAGGYDTVLIAGTVTNVCCESSARDAMMMSFKTVMVSDANAANSDEEHNASLVNFYVTFGDVMDTAYLIERLEANAAARIAAE
jgi:ureidoacrylate peracid hydrolase